MRIEEYLYLNMEPDILRAKIRAKIEEKNFSVRQVAKLSNVSPSALQNFLAGVIKNPTLETIAALAKTLDCDLTELVSRSDVVIKQSDYKSPWNTKIFKDIVQYIAELQEEESFVLSSEEALLMIKEIYYYSLSKEKQRMDKDFAQWVFKKTASKGRL